MPSWNNNTEYESLIYHQNLVLHRNVPLFNRISTHAGSNWAMTEILVDESWQSGCTTWFIGEANKFHPHDWNFATLLEGAWSCCEANSSPPSINSNAQLSWFDPGGFFLRWVYGKSQLLRCAALPLFSTQHLWFNFFGFHSFSYWQACAPSVLVYNSFN